jgi:hypothetical protein
VPHNHVLIRKQSQCPRSMLKAMQTRPCSGCIGARPSSAFKPSTIPSSVSRSRRTGPRCHHVASVVRTVASEGRKVLARPFEDRSSLLEWIESKLNLIASSLDGRTRNLLKTWKIDLSVVDVVGLRYQFCLAVASRWYLFSELA